MLGCSFSGVSNKWQCECDQPGKGYPNRNKHITRSYSQFILICANVLDLDIHSLLQHSLDVLTRLCHQDVLWWYWDVVASYRWPLNIQCSREIMRSVTHLFLCCWRVRFLTQIRPSVMTDVTSWLVFVRDSTTFVALVSHDLLVPEKFQYNLDK